MWSIESPASSSTVASHAPNVGIVDPELPHATSSIDGSTRRIAMAASAARRPYSAALVCPICHGPSISLPRHQVRILYGSAWPLAARRSAISVPARSVAVLHKVARRVGAAGPEVHREHRLHAGQARPGDELVGADRVGLDRPPGEVVPLGPPVAGADAILPVVAGDEVPARIADRRHPESSGQIDDVVTPAVGVSGGMPGLEDAAVDGPAHVLDERPEDTRRRRSRLRGSGRSPSAHQPSTVSVK